MKMILNIDGFAGLFIPADENCDLSEVGMTIGYEFRLINEAELPEARPTRRWIWSASGPIVIEPFTAEEVREERDKILTSVVDPVVGNAMRWADLTAEHQQAWADYRRALLDVTNQVGFPQNVIWPVSPNKVMK